MLSNLPRATIIVHDDPFSIFFTTKREQLLNLLNDVSVATCATRVQIILCKFCSFKTIFFAEQAVVHLKVDWKNFTFWLTVFGNFLSIPRQRSLQTMRRVQLSARASIRHHSPMGK